MRNIYSHIHYLLRLFIFIYIAMFCSCLNNDLSYLSLRRIDISKEKQARIDTLYNCQQKSVYILQLDKGRGIDDFSRFFILAKNLGDKTEMAYIIENIPQNLNAIVSKDYFALFDWHDPDSNSWGWFCIKDHKIEKPLPFIDTILDSIRTSSEEYFLLREHNGAISYYNSKSVNETSKVNINYSDFVIENSDLNIDSLDYGLYKLIDKNLLLISSNGNDLLKQEDGLYYVPFPGRSVVAKYSIESMMVTIDSLSKVEKPLA